MKNLGRLCLLASFFVLLSAGAWGQVPLPYYDGFAYTDGTVLGGQGNWVNNNTGDTVAVIAGSLSYPGFAASTGNRVAFDGAGMDPTTRFDSTSWGSVYFSFLFRVTNLGSLGASGGYFIHFYQSPTSTTSASLVYTRPNGADIDIGIATRLNAPISWWGPLSLNTTYLIVASYDFIVGTTNDSSRLWVDPDPSTFGAAADPAPTISSMNNNTDLSAVQRLAIRQDGSTTTPFIELDELRIGRTWADVTPSNASAVIAVKGGLIPRELRLEQNYPNPFNPSTTIEFSVASMQPVTVKIHDLLGREVASLVNQTLSPGTYRVHWDAASSPSGIYFYSVRAGSEAQTRRMILMK